MSTLEQTSGKIRLRLEDGTYQDFDNNQEAQKWLNENRHHVVEQLSPKEVELPTQDIATPLPRKGIDYLQGTVPYTATPSDFSALFGKSRIKGVRRALERNPNALDNYNIFDNITDFYRIGSGGMINRLSPTQNLRLLYDVATGENVVDSMLGNHGILPDKTAEEYPWLSFILNGVVDAGTGLGIRKSVDYSQGYKPIGKGSSSEVYVSNNPLKRKYVYKVSSITPEEMAEINELPRTVPSEYVSKWTNGRNIYKQKRVTPTSNPNLQSFNRLARAKGFIQRLFPGDTETVYHNPITNKVMLDLPGNWGIDKFGRTVSFDPAVLNLEDYLSMLKKGGQLNGTTKT